jgi:PadR family transcriptional regulator, regulatory protein AphA
MKPISTLGHALLGLLSAGEMTGYELTQAFDISLANVWSAKHSQIYPELAKLQEAGLIRQTDAGPRGSKRYSATETGRAEVRRWLAEPPAPQALRTEALLRVFFLGMAEPGTASRYLREQAEQHRAKLESYRRIASHIPDSPESLWNRVALEAGIRHERAMVDWAEWAAAESTRHHR